MRKFGVVLGVVTVAIGIGMCVRDAHGLGGWDALRQR